MHVAETDQLSTQKYVDSAEKMNISYFCSCFIRYMFTEPYLLFVKTSDTGNSCDISQKGSSQEHVLLAGEYQIGQVIGRGASASVHRALNLCTGEIVAVKKFDISNITKRALASIMVEADLLKQLDHPNIVQFHGYMKTKEHLFFVMEYVDEGPLSGVIRDFGVLSERVCATYTLQLLHGLAYLHHNAILHRDIKGSNILITKSGDAKLADFGVSTSANSASGQRRSVVGSPYWMAPECISLAGYSFASDIWSVACVCIEMLMGEPFHFQLQPLAAMYKIVEEPVPPLPTNLSAEFMEVLRVCFSKDPNARPTAVALLAHPAFRPASERVKLSPHGNKAGSLPRLNATSSVPQSQGQPQPAVAGAAASSSSAPSEATPPPPPSVRRANGSLVSPRPKLEPDTAEGKCILRASACAVIQSVDELRNKLRASRRTAHPDELAKQKLLAQLIPHMAREPTAATSAEGAPSGNASSETVSKSPRSGSMISLQLPSIRTASPPPAHTPVSDSAHAVQILYAESGPNQPAVVESTPPVRWNRVEVSPRTKPASAPRTSLGRGDSAPRPLSTRGTLPALSALSAPQLGVLSGNSSSNTISKSALPVAAPVPESQIAPVSQHDAESEISSAQALEAMWLKVEETYSEMSKLKRQLEERDEELARVKHDRDTLRIRYTEEAVQKNEAIALAFWALRPSAPLPRDEIERRLRSLAERNQHKQQSHITSPQAKKNPPQLVTPATLHHPVPPSSPAPAPPTSSSISDRVVVQAPPNIRPKDSPKNIRRKQSTSPSRAGNEGSPRIPTWTKKAWM